MKHIKDTSSLFSVKADLDDSASPLTEGGPHAGRGCGVAKAGKQSMTIPILGHFISIKGRRECWNTVRRIPLAAHLNNSPVNIIYPPDAGGPTAREKMNLPHVISRRDVVATVAVSACGRPNDQHRDTKNRSRSAESGYLEAALEPRGAETSSGNNYRVRRSPIASISLPLDSNHPAHLLFRDQPC